jgi:hypothetical protein
MSAITSYIRHLIVVGILLLVSKFGLPLEGANEMANGLALFLIGTGTWAVVKYAPEFAKQLGLLLFMMVHIVSCSAGQREAVMGIPIKACVFTPEGRVCYSSKGGLALEILSEK